MHTEIKRFLEKWTSDDNYKASFAKNPNALLDEEGFSFPKEAVLPIIGMPAPELLHDGVLSYDRFIQKKLKHREQLRFSGTPLNTTFRLWRQRQMHRTLFELGDASAIGIVHPPYAFELTKGCTVGCWFCGISAEAFEGYWPFKQNETLWRAMLRILSSKLGKRSASTGFCYWATDPLDNPDYERFLDTFWEELGYFPQTTTAQAHRDIPRTRALLELSQKRNGFVDRFSLVTRKAMHLIHAAFTPDELENVELITQFNSESAGKAIAGRARELVETRSQEGKSLPKGVKEDNDSTIACVSGFIISPMEEKIVLISPCRGSITEKGYYEYKEATFTDAASFKAGITSLIHNMKIALELSDRITLSPFISIEEDNGTLHVSYRSGVLSLPGFPHAKEILPLLTNKVTTPLDVANTLSHMDPATLFGTLNKMLHSGLFHEKELL